MKKLGGFIVAACLATSLIGGPALASTTQQDRQPTRAETLELCKAFFSADGCEAVAGSWHKAVTSGDRDAIERFANRLMAKAGVTPTSRPPECRDIFSETVCGTAEGAVALAKDVASRPVYYVNWLRTVIVGITDEVVYQITCILTQSCARGAGGFGKGRSADVCRMVFSDAVCDQVDEIRRNPGGYVAYWLNYYYQIVRCQIDPACNPLIIFCTELTCPRATLPKPVR